MRYGAEYGYGGAEHGYGAEDFVSIYDALPAPESLWSVARRLRRAYTGPVIRVRRSSDNVEQDFYGSGASGLVSPEAIRAFNGWNLLSNSEDLRTTTEGLSGSNWSATTTSPATQSVSTVTAQNPYGVTGNVSRLVMSLNGETTSAVSVRRRQTKSITEAGSYTYSFWARSYDGASSYTASILVGTGAETITITPQWQRFSVTRSLSTGSNACDVFLRGGQTPVHSDSVDILIWGAQLEAGSFPTTYEPRTTTGAGSSFLVTRYDQSGNARHATQATTTLQPIVCESGVHVVNSGGRLTSKHVAADARRLAVANSTNIYNFMHNGDGGTVLFVYQANDTAATKGIVANRQSGVGFRISSTLAENINVEVYNGTASALTVTKTGSFTTNAIGVTQIDADNATAADREKTWLNGTELATYNALTNTPSTANAGSDLNIGARGTSDPFDGTIGDIGIWEGSLTEAQRKLVEADQGRFNSITVAP